jgi:hypothetical protein
MRVMQVSVFVGSLLSLVVIGPAISIAADLDGRLGVRDVSVHANSVRTIVAADGCGWGCRGGCPHRYSCNALYGVNGPDGGPAYWTRYTMSGWHYR